MENRFQYILLILVVGIFGLSLPALAQEDALVSGDADSIDNEFFSFGVSAGVLNIQDFGSEYTLGANFTFAATEDFFLQFNYLIADAGLSSFEESQGQLIDGDDRKFNHFDLLVGYKLFQAEFFPSEGNAKLSGFYLVGGVGDTDFGGEGSFTYTLGAGYEFALARRFIVRADYRHYIYESNLIAEKENTHNGGFSIGFNYLL
ncbi:outer membrane beta-barrel protein [Alteromonadaceae bacterium Bs31]|nr:outer membrane beta-barrel protein [Alteromonadaceae bacterium Bs31]